MKSLGPIEWVVDVAVAVAVAVVVAAIVVLSSSVVSAKDPFLRNIPGCHVATTRIFEPQRRHNPRAQTTSPLPRGHTKCTDSSQNASQRGPQLIINH